METEASVMPVMPNLNAPTTHSQALITKPRFKTVFINYGQHRFSDNSFNDHYARPLSRVSSKPHQVEPKGNPGKRANSAIDL